MFSLDHYTRRLNQYEGKLFEHIKWFGKNSVYNNSLSDYAWRFKLVWT